jgi:4-hydroxy-4-methyl-2-oxoglutarate aldolase
MMPELAEEMARLGAQLRTALVSDALDTFGRRKQCLGAGIAPLSPGVVVVGRAFTVSAIPSDEPASTPYVGLLRALDAVRAGEIFCYPTARSDRAAVWGELVSASSLAKGAVGVVTDGLVRDVARIREIGFPVFCRGALPYDVNGRLEVLDHGQVIEIDGVRITPGDLVVADDDGVVIVPRDVEQEVIEHCRVKEARERRFRAAVESGVPALDAFERFDVL